MSDSESDDDAPLVRPTKKTKQIVSGSDSSDDDFIAPVKREKNPPKRKPKNEPAWRHDIYASGKKVKKVKKEVKSEDEDDDDFDPSEETKPEKKRKTKVKVKKETKRKTKVRVKKEGKGKTPAKKKRKQYEMPGQKKDPPDELNGLRIFYESTYEQMPDSEMAQNWLLIHGLLPRQLAEKLVKSGGKGKKSSASTRKRKRNVESDTKSAKKRKTKPKTKKEKKTPGKKTPKKPTRRKLAIQSGSEDDSSSDDDAPIQK